MLDWDLIWAELWEWCSTRKSRAERSAVDLPRTTMYEIQRIVERHVAPILKDRDVMADGLIACQKQLRKAVLEKNGVFDEVE